jgi:hypothetical protein
VRPDSKEVWAAHLDAAGPEAEQTGRALLLLLLLFLLLFGLHWLRVTRDCVSGDASHIAETQDRGRGGAEQQT